MKIAYPNFLNLNYLFIILLSCGLSTWSVAAEQRYDQQAEPDRLNSYLQQVIHPQAFRNYQNIQELDRVAAFIKQQLEQFSIPCEYQPYQVKGKTYRNVICHLQMGHAKKVILGAHYDVYGNFKGADDNASGVVGLIETARILAANKASLKQNVDFVFYTLEEPPYFRTEHMGSYIRAQSILKQKIKFKRCIFWK